MSGRLALLRAAGQLFRAPRPWPGPSAGATRTRSSAYGPRERTPAGVGAWGAAAVGRRAGVRTWAPLAMAAKVDLNTSTDWKEAKCKCAQRGRGRGPPHVGFRGWTAPHQQLFLLRPVEVEAPYTLVRTPQFPTTPPPPNAPPPRSQPHKPVHLHRVQVPCQERSEEGGRTPLEWVTAPPEVPAEILQDLPPCSVVQEGN